MEKTKGHVCPTCAGQLNLDEERRLYLCPFCGVTFDYEYFREDDVLQRGANNLEDGEFNAACEAYKFMLAKDPHNFEALRGLLFAAAGLKAEKELMDEQTFRSLNYKTSEDEMARALSDCDPQDKEYFEAIEQIFQKGKRYQILHNENEKSSDQRKFLYREIDRQNERADFYMVHLRDRAGTVSCEPKKTLITALIVWCAPTILMALLTRFSPMIWIYFLAAGVPCLIISAVCLLKIRGYSQIQEVIKEKSAEIEKITAQIDANDKECTGLRAEIRALTHKLTSRGKEKK